MIKNNDFLFPGNSAKKLKDKEIEYKTNVFIYFQSINTGQDLICNLPKQYQVYRCMFPCYFYSFVVPSTYVVFAIDCIINFMRYKYKMKIDFFYN